MITPADIKKKALRIWDSGKFHADWCGGENIFPLDIPFGKKNGSYISENFADIRDSILLLENSSKAKTGYGYSVEYKTVAHRQLGRQNIPVRIFIESESDFLKLCGRTGQFEEFRNAWAETKKEIPKLCGFMKCKPLEAAKNIRQWNKLLKVCLFFTKNPEPGIYIRQIVIPGVDTKFIEANKKIISTLLVYLDPDKYGQETVSLSHHGFEKHFGLLYDEPVIRFRILDTDIFLNGISDITLPLSQFSELKIDADRVFITENKINGLAFPMVKKSIVIFGLGYGIQSLTDIRWIKNLEVFYWGDIDSHGFSILSIARSIIPRCKSMLMDEKTLYAHIKNSVHEPDSKRFTGRLTCLTSEEADLFEKLKNNTLGENLRLEQEMIEFNYLMEWLKKMEIINHI